MIVRLTAEADSDLESIADYIAQDNPPRALSFVLELRDNCMNMTLIPPYAHQRLRQTNVMSCFRLWLPG